MFFRRKEGRTEIPTATVAAVLIAVVALAVSIGVARWSWLILDEQIKLRQDFIDLKTSQEQLNTQFDFWDKKVESERQQLKQEMDALKK